MSRTTTVAGPRPNKHQIRHRHNACPATPAPKEAFDVH